MKKNIIALACLLHTILFAHASGTPTVTPQAKESFQKDFPKALYATWETADAGLYAVRFVNNNQSAIAYYEENGKAMGLGKIITPNEMQCLPASVQQTLIRTCDECRVLNAQEWILPAARLYYFDILTSTGAFAIGIDHNGKIQKKKYFNVSDGRIY